jgi:hypothetical protein
MDHTKIKEHVVKNDSLQEGAVMRFAHSFVIVVALLLGCSAGFAAPANSEEPNLVKNGHLDDATDPLKFFLTHFFHCIMLGELYRDQFVRFNVNTKF